MEKLYVFLSKSIVAVAGLFLLSAVTPAQAQFTVTGLVTNTSCYGQTNGGINVTVTGAGGGPSTGNYCLPTYNNPSCNCPITWDFINNFYTTGGSTNISNLNSGCNGTLPNNYTFFPTQIVTVNPGQAFGVNVQSATSGCNTTFDQGFRIWVDWNADGDFSDGGENVWNSGTSGDQLFTGNVTVPNGTACGAKRMRVRSKYADTPGPNATCNQIDYGECEDYTVQVCSPATYLWSNGATTEDISGLAAGAYTVTVTSGNQSSVVLFNVNQPSQVITNITAAGNDTLLCPGGETTALTASGQPTWTYTWSSGTTGNTYTATQPGVYSVTVSNTNGCSATDQITVLSASATNPPVITPSDTTLVCQGNSVTLSVTPSTGVTWQPTGETTSTISVSQSGSFYVTYTDASGCTGQSLPATVLVVAPPTATITPDGPTDFCTGGSVTLTSNYTSGNSWSNGSTAPSITVSTAGTYGLTVSIDGCTDAASTVDVTVNALPVPEITPSGPLEFCEGGSVNLSSNYPNGNYWSSTSVMQQITVNTTSSYSLTVTDANGCSASTGPVDVTVNPAPPVPVITADGPTAICSGSTVVLSSSASSGNLWSNNETTNSISVTAGGSYSLTVTDATGCTAASAATQVTVNPVPTAAFDLPSSTCISDNATVTYTGTASAGATYDWNFGNANVVSGSGAGPYTLSFDSIGSYAVSLQVTQPASGCVSSVDTDNIVVNENPSADFTTSVAGVCEGGNMTIAYNGLAPAGSGYVWDFGNGTVISGSGQGPYDVQFNNAGTQTISLTVTQGSCESLPFTVPVTVYSLPNPSFAVDESVACDSLAATFYPEETGGSYSWNFGDGASSNEASPTHVYTAGNYSVSLSVVDANGCVNAVTDTALIQVYNTPVAAFVTTPELADTLNMDEAVITFNNQSQHGTSYDWSFGDGELTSEHSPVHGYNQSGEYTVELVVANPLGCSDTATSQTFFVLPGAVTFVPNTFTPNGDGVNEIFKIYSYRYKQAYFVVYDRIGQKVFETTDIENGWDGRMKGMACNTGVYVYYAKIIYLTGEEKELFGDVTLLR